MQPQPPGAPDRAKEIFLSAVEIPAEAGRGKFLRDACGNDERLRREVEELLAHNARLGSFLEEGDDDRG